MSDNYRADAYKRYRDEGRCIVCGVEAKRKKVLRTPGERPFYQYCERHYTSRRARALKGAQLIARMEALGITQEELEERLTTVATQVDYEHRVASGQVPSEQSIEQEIQALLGASAPRVPNKGASRSEEEEE